MVSNFDPKFLQSCSSFHICSSNQSFLRRTAESLNFQSFAARSAPADCSMVISAGGNESFGRTFAPSSKVFQGLQDPVGLDLGLFQTHLDLICPGRIWWNSEELVTGKSNTKSIELYIGRNERSRHFCCLPSPSYPFLVLLLFFLSLAWRAPSDP